MTTDTEVQPTIAEPVNRDSVRAKIFSGKKVKKEVIDFFGTQIELRQSALGKILEAQNNPDRKSALINFLIEDAYVPGTEERVFEDTDEASLRNLPFGADFIRVNGALERLSEVNFLDKKDTSNGTQA